MPFSSLNGLHQLGADFFFLFTEIQIIVFVFLNNKDKFNYEKYCKQQQQQLPIISKVTMIANILNNYIQ